MNAFLPTLPKPVIFNAVMLNEILRHIPYPNWSERDFSCPFNCVRIDEGTAEYLRVKMLFENATNPPATLQTNLLNILKIENPFLFALFYMNLLKKENRNVTSEVIIHNLFHGTRISNLQEILSVNFDWRKCRSATYGRGVYFSTESTYANTYALRTGSNFKVIILAKVAISNICPGDKFMVFPINADASVNGNGTIVVKYEDNDFYPSYIIIAENEAPRGEFVLKSSASSLSPFYSHRNINETLKCIINKLFINNDSDKTTT